MNYELNLDQCADLITAVPNNTMMLQGHMGVGKTSVAGLIHLKKPQHTVFYCDCTTKDLGDLTIPNIVQMDTATGYVTYLTNEELGLHLNEPIILMIDEYGKANPSVKLALTRLMLERKMGSVTLHPDSIVFCTTNLGSEGVGDILPAHARNRLTIVNVRKSTAMEWITWGINNGIDHSVLSWAKDNEMIFQGFDQVRDPSDNPYIFHPAEQRTSFVTPRSLEKLSNIVKHLIDEETLIAAACGTIGERGGMDCIAHIKMSDQLPTRESIKTDPMNAIVPKSASATCMVVFRSLATMDKEYITPWMTYLNRLDTEAQGMFANGVRTKKYQHQTLVMTNAKFSQFMRENQYMFKADDTHDV
jgi:hypothetical protein